MKMVLANWYPFKPGETVGPHASASTLLLVCLRGHGRIEVPGEAWQMSPGQALAVPWEHPLRYVAAEQEPFTLGGVHWSDQADPPHRAVATWPLPVDTTASRCVRRWDPAGHLQPVLMRLIAVFGDPANGSAQHQALVESLSAVLQAEWELLADASGAADVSASLGAVASWLRLVLGRTVSRAEMAQRAGMAESTFAAAFRTCYGVPPMRYLAELRLTCAAELLATTALPVGEVARRCGFSDAPWFARAFARKYQISATAWRKARRRL